MRVGLIGASGYSGEELLDLLLRHPRVTIAFAASRRHSGRRLVDIHPRFAHLPAARELSFVAPDDVPTADLVFLALPHGISAAHAIPLLRDGVRVVDLSADFRLKDPALHQEFYGGQHPAPELLEQAVYGLPELNREAISTASLVAAPGCYPTSIILPCLPLLRQRLVRPTGIIADCLSSPSGAGRKPDTAFLFNECHESLRPYGVVRHRHIPEIEQELSRIAGRSLRIQFTPHLVPVNRGILTTLYLAPAADPLTEADLASIGRAFAEAYTHEPFIRLLREPHLPDTARVARTNLMEIAWRADLRTGRLIVMSAEDNLGKGASHQAVQCMNIMAGFEETLGLLPTPARNP